MTPREFPEQTIVLQRPPSMSEEECGPLGIHNDGETCVSCWRPTWRERLSILLFGRVWLGILSGQTQPPVWLDGSRQIFREVQPERDRGIAAGIKWPRPQMEKTR